MKDITIGTILKKAAKKENELYLLYKNAGRRVKDDRIRTILMYCVNTKGLPGKN